MKWVLLEKLPRILFLDGGQLAEDAPPREFFTQPKCEEREAISGKDAVSWELA